MNKTKIVATVGPASEDIKVLREMIINGVDVIRINMSHANHDFCRQIVDKINTLNKELNRHVAIMFDTHGPDIRVGKFVNGSAFFQKGSKIRIYNKELLGDNTKFSVDYKDIIGDVYVGTIIKLNDGKVSLKVVEKDFSSLICEVLNDGYVFDNRGVNIPKMKLSRPFLSDQDKADIRLACELKVDFIALSFVGCVEDVLMANDLLIDLDNDHISLISKIESERALEEIDEIIKVSDGVMVARGDLGTEVPAEKIPGLQKKIIAKAHALSKISIVATEMLSSMESSLVPTRAEVSDVANAVLDGTDAVMLSGETTIGKYPIGTIQMMEKIISSAEQDINYNDFLQKTMKTEKQDTTGLISYSVAECAMRLKCKVIVTPTLSGRTARKMSRFRPMCPIIALTPHDDVIKSLALNFGVYGVKVDEFENFDHIQKVCKETARQFIDHKEGDKIVITGGYPMRAGRTTNFLHIDEL